MKKQAVLRRAIKAIRLARVKIQEIKYAIRGEGKEPPVSFRNKHLWKEKQDKAKKQLDNLYEKLDKETDSDKKKQLEKNIDKQEKEIEKLSEKITAA